MKTKQSLRPTLHKLNRQRYQNKVESARRLSDDIEAKTMADLNFLFPHYVYKQLIKIYR
jgi:hypothetical protein